jgi:hypothetical protein
MKFYDIKRKKSFETTKFKVVTKLVKGRKRKFAVATAPSGMKVYRVM